MASHGGHDHGMVSARWRPLPPWYNAHLVEGERTLPQIAPSDEMMRLMLEDTASFAFSPIGGDVVLLKTPLSYILCHCLGLDSCGVGTTVFPSLARYVRVAGVRVVREVPFLERAENTVTFDISDCPFVQ